jgi:hypothetical protein
MKSVSSSRVLFVTAISLIVSAAVLAQTPSGNTAPKYDPANEVKVKGAVDDIKIVPGPLEGVHLVVKSSDETILVHVAPENFLKEMGTTFNKGDVVEVVGCKIKASDGTDELLARQVTKGTDELQVRDKKGKPVWTTWSPGKN